MDANDPAALRATSAFYRVIQEAGRIAKAGTLRNYRSLMPMAQEARKPMFDLSPADGAIGSHAQLVRVCERDFRQLAEAIAQASGLTASENTL